MRAARVHGHADLRIESIELPPPADGELQLSVVAALTCGTDVKTLARGHPAAPACPYTLGHELVGTVVDKGAGVPDFDYGQLVAVANSAPCQSCFYCRLGQTTLCENPCYLFGAFAERVNVPARIVHQNVLPAPSNVDPAVAALIEPLACAHHAVDDLELRPNDDVVIVGAGPLGLMITALLVDRGGRAIVIDPHPDRLALASRFGASSTIRSNRSEDDVTLVRAATSSGRGGGHVFEAVGRSETWLAAEAMARPGGVVTFFGGCASGTTVEFSADRLHYSEITLRGVYHHTPATVRRAAETIASGRWPLSALLGPRVGLDDLPSVLVPSHGVRPPKYVVEPGP